MRSLESTIRKEVMTNDSQFLFDLLSHVLKEIPQEACSILLRSEQPAVAISAVRYRHARHPFLIELNYMTSNLDHAKILQIFNQYGGTDQVRFTWYPEEEHKEMELILYRNGLDLYHTNLPSNNKQLIPKREVLEHLPTSIAMDPNALRYLRLGEVWNKRIKKWQLKLQKASKQAIEDQLSAFYASLPYSPQLISKRRNTSAGIDYHNENKSTRISIHIEDTSFINLILGRSAIKKEIQKMQQSLEMLSQIKLASISKWELYFK